MEEEIESVTSSEKKSVDRRRLDDLESRVTDLELKLKILGECKCNRSTNLETQHSDDEETETVIGLNFESLTSAAAEVIDVTGQSTAHSEDILTLAGGDANATNTAHSSATLSTDSKLGDSTSANTAANGNNGIPVSTISSLRLRLSNGIRIRDIKKYRRAQVKLKRCDQVDATGTSPSEFGISNNKSTLTSTKKESDISSKKHPVLPRKGNGARVVQVSAPTSPHKKQFVCHVCSKRFGQKSDLTRHIRVHTGDKPFECAFCSKKLSERRSLVSHMRSHTGERPYACQLCPKKFSQSQSLVVHVRTHTGERPYACQMCPKTFTIPGNLQVHLRVHTREKPYSCPFCPKVFAQRGQLKLHLNRHPEETQQP